MVSICLNYAIQHYLLKLVAELISLEVPLSNPLRIPIHLSDIRLMWHFSGDDGELSSLTAAVDNPLVTAYAAPSVILNPSSSNKVDKPSLHGLPTLMMSFLDHSSYQTTSRGVTNH